MPCYHPLRAWQRGSAAPVFSVPAGNGYRMFEVPCSRCVGCRLDRSQQAAVRCMHEAQMHSENCFATFTYDAAHLPADLSLHYRHFQLFMKSLRKASLPKHIRFYVCGEYGEKYSRPHFHALLFGFSPPDKRFFKRAKSGDRLYTSEFLDGLWRRGSVIVGDVTFDSAAYCARYIMKKQLGPEAKSVIRACELGCCAPMPMREIIDVTTGQAVYRAHEFCKMSLRPGIGAHWYDKFFTDVFPHDRVVVRGATCRVPKYYTTLLDRVSPLYVAFLKAQRALKASLRFDERSPRRLRDMEVVTHAAMKLLPRPLT